MTARALLADLAARDVRLSVAGDRLRVNAPRGVLTTELRRTLSEHKVELLSLLSGRGESPGTLLASLSLRFAGHSNHHAALDRFCELADEYHHQHGMSVVKAASYAHTGVLFEYGDGGGQ